MTDETKNRDSFPEQKLKNISVSDRGGGVGPAGQDGRDRADRRPGPDHGGDL